LTARLCAVAGIALAAASPAWASQEPDYGATSPKDKLEIAVGPVLWSRPEVDRQLEIRVLLKDHREVGYLAIVPRKVEIKPIMAPRVQPLWHTVRNSGGTFGINGGFFNRSDGVPASFQVADGRPIADPRQNRALVGNPALRAYLPAIFDRPEWRVWQTPAGRHVTFEAHHIKAAPGWRLVHALQAGPLLLPRLEDREGAFVRGHDDAIASTSRAARSAIGLRNDGATLLVCLPKPPSPGMTILELQAFMAAIGSVEALALDGGESSGLVIRPPDPKALWWGHDSRTRSALVVMAEPPRKPKGKATPAKHNTDSHGH
jgi:hypothetical protein